MDSAMVIDLGRESLWVAVMISGPILLVALVVGLVIGIIQAATSINEITLSFIPKLEAMVATLILVGSWQIGMLVEFTRRMYERIPALFM